MNILAIGAHPDDIELYAGGTLAKYAKRGDKVFMVTATNGNVGSAVLTMEEIAAVRKREAKKSAELIGAEYICLDYDDEMFFEDKNARLAFINLVRYCKADIILTHSPIDYNPDHELTGKIVKDIAVMIPVGHIKTENPPNDRIPNIFYWEPVHGLGFVPEEYVDITDTFETKRDMMAQHQSQIQWMKANFENSLEFSEDDFFFEATINSRYRGIQCGVKYAEGFVRANDAFRVVPRRLLP